MPETNFINAERFARKIKEEGAISGGYLTGDETLKLVRDFNQKYVGDGAECVVVDVDGTRRAANKVEEKDRKIVAAITYSEMTPLFAKQVFYAQRVLETLFPHNFPHFYAVAGSVKESPDRSGSIRQKIEAASMIESPITKTFRAYDKLNPKYPFSRVIEKMKSLRIPLGFDDTRVNFVLAADGGVYYLDTLIPFTSSWNIDLIEKYMQTNNYNKTEIEIVRKSVKRLMELGV